ncbi:MAG: YigZ family protein [Lachnospiraceae bacterium]|nr:YigZ family protein [Lachnospiraceae bacterium]
METEGRKEQTMGYKTVAGQGLAEYADKKSRFIGQAWPVYSEDEARMILEETRKEYWDASHHVFAYRLAGDIQRFSDDGEPSGTSGKPTLDVLLGADVKNVLVITTRYFGGTLLGTGGLVRAYTKAAQLALEAAGIIEKRIYARCSIHMDYTFLGKLQYLTAKLGVLTEGVEYTDEVIMRLLIPVEEVQAFAREVTAATDGKLTVGEEGRTWGARCGSEVRLFDEPL